jgi:hypothetical protein
VGIFGYPAIVSDLKKARSELSTISARSTAARAIALVLCGRSVAVE